MILIRTVVAAAAVLATTSAGHGPSMHSSDTQYPSPVTHDAASLYKASHAAPLQLPDEGPMPELSGASAWLNSKPLTKADLKGHVVVIDFFTYSCVNCLRALPYVKAWYAQYRKEGLIVIGIHAPEFDFEHDRTNVERMLKKLGITYPVAMDNDMKIWNAFHNQYWPAHYFVDANGRIRYHHFGEGEYEKSENVIRTLLAEAHHAADSAKTMSMPTVSAQVTGTGVEAAPDFTDVASPETYIGYARAAHFASTPDMARDEAATYKFPQSLTQNAWGLQGRWIVTSEYGESETTGGQITFRFHARDLHLVLGPGADGKPVRFHVTIDGKVPGADAGTDVDAQGNGIVKEHRLYQLIRQHETVHDRIFVITFDAPHVRAYAFTFG
jgi:thiol-disulfide isomerase/thioredoxin